MRKSGHLMGEIVEGNDESVQEFEDFKAEIKKSDSKENSCCM